MSGFSLRAMQHEPERKCVICAAPFKPNAMGRAGGQLTCTSIPCTREHKKRKQKEGHARRKVNRERKG